jgi:hypothetical protein
MTKPKFNQEWWTKQRVDNGLERFIRDFADETGSNLPTTFIVYNEMIGEDKGRSQKDRLYPPAAAILRQYENFVALWWRFGYLVEVKAKSKKYILTPEIEARLREIYSHRFRANERPADLPGPKEYAKQLGMPGFVVTHWAQELGLAHTKEPPWSDEELGLLEKHGYKTPPVIARIFREHGFKRTTTAIQLMRKRRMVNKASPYYSVNALAKLFGVDAHGVKHWIDKGFLKFIMKGTRREEAPQTGDTRLVHKDWVYEFIVRYPDVFDIKKVDQLWFLHIVTRGEVKLAFSDESKMSKRTEGQTIEAPVEWRKSKLKENGKEKKYKSSGKSLDFLRSAEELAADKPHGTLIKHIGGCRCEPCKKARYDYDKERREAQKNGNYNGMVSAELARQHIEKLAEQGIGFKRVSRIAKVNHNNIWKIKTGEKNKIRVSTETKILAVTAEALADGAPVDATETWNRIDWLLKKGLTKTAIAKRLGSKTPSLQIGKKQVRKQTAVKIEEIYNEIRQETGEGNVRYL